MEKEEIGKMDIRMVIEEIEETEATEETEEIEGIEDKEVREQNEVVTEEIVEIGERIEETEAIGMMASADVEEEEVEGGFTTTETIIIKTNSRQRPMKRIKSPRFPFPKGENAGQNAVSTSSVPSSPSP